MDSLATVLRRIPLFADLPPGGLAKIIADLREERHPRGTAICYEGDEASDFYIVKSGEVEVLVNRAGNQREVVAINGPSEWFGERALFSASSRSATVIARTDVELWRLTKEKFDGLIEENPWLILHFTQVLSDRLYSRNQDLSKIQSAFTFQTEFLFQAQPPDRQHLLLHTAILSALDPAIVQVLTGHPEVEVVFRTLVAESALVARHDGVFVYPEAVRDFLLTRLAASVGPEGIRTLHQRAAVCYEQVGQWDDALDHALAADEFSVAARLLTTHVDECFQHDQLDILHKWLARFPLEWRTGALASLGTRLEQALRPATTGQSAPPRVLVSSRTQWWLGAILGLVAGLGIALAPPFPGLDTTSMHMLGLLMWAVIFWVFDLFPDYVVGIGLMIGWILFDMVPPEVAVSGFTTSPFFLIIGVLGMTAALQSSGLLFRLALYILRSFPLTYRGQAMGLALSGTGITTSIPDTTSGTAIAGPIILALSDSLGYTRRSNGSAGLAMSALLGFGQMSPFFLTGAAENLLAWGLLTESARLEITWGGWFLAALPLAVVTFVLAFVTTMLLFPPEFQPTISRGLIHTQIEALGPMSRAEVINAGVVVGAMVGWISAPYHGVDVAWVAMSGLALLLATNLLDRATFRSGINWDFLFYLGAVLSLTSVVRKLGIDAWIIHQLTPILEPLTATPTKFLMGMTLAIFAARFILPSFPLVSLLTVTIVPIAANAGIQPQALLLVICTSVAIWFLPYQSTCYLALYFGTKEKAFSHGQVRLLAWSYGVIYLLAVLAAIPYWRWLELIP
ncbi:MAG: cyclic nucleotide-binding domain-containing protein [Deltaproteobacteria bacterium]|nr:cyclic nucleotide-binding domain-containing protein [Deltaproteobacteria bacterium]